MRKIKLTPRQARIVEMLSQGYEPGRGRGRAG